MLVKQRFPHNLSNQVDRNRHNKRESCHDLRDRRDFFRCKRARGLQNRISVIHIVIPATTQIGKVTQLENRRRINRSRIGGKKDPDHMFRKRDVRGPLLTASLRAFHCPHYSLSHHRSTDRPHQSGWKNYCIRKHASRSRPRDYRRGRRRQRRQLLRLCLSILYLLITCSRLIRDAGK